MTETRSLFTNLRYENYASARYLGFTCGSFHRMSHYLLGMAIELSYKQICYELRELGIEFSNTENKLIERSHSLQALHELCKSKGRLNDIKNYEDFLFYADAFYKTRYPSQVSESSKIALTKFGSLSFSARNIYPFDDLMSQIDLDLFNLTNDPNATVIFSAIKHTNTHFSNSLFHSNGIFYGLIPKFTPFLNLENPTYAESLEFLEKRKETILISREVYLHDSLENSLLYNIENFTKLFGSFR